MTEAVLQEGVLPSFEELEFLPQEDDLYLEVFGHHEPQHDYADEESWNEESWEKDY
jgi:hypothetical protein